MIVKLLNHTNWPDEQTKSQYKLAYISNDTELFNIMQADIDQQLIAIDGKPLVVIKQKLTDINAHQYDAIYLGADHNSQVSNFANQIRQTNTLLFTNNSAAKRDYMINFVNQQQSNHKFEVNRSNIVFENLEIDTSITLLGGTELDIAQLFRQTELQLQTIVSTLLEKEQLLQQASNELNTKHLQIEQQQQQLQKNRQQITQFRQELSLKEQKLDNTNQQLQLLNQKLGNLNQDVKQVSEQLSTQRQALTAQTKQNQQQQTVIDQQQAKLTELNDTIEEKSVFLATQEQRINQQSSQLTEQTATIDIQRKRLWLIFAILVGFISLLIYILKINKDKHIAHANIQASRAKLLTLAEIGKDLTSYLELEQVLEHVYLNLDRVLDANVFLVGILQQDKDQILAPLVVENNVKLRHATFSLKDNLLPAVHCVKHNKEVIIQDKNDQIRYFGQPMNRYEGTLAMETVVYQPLCIDDKLIGCLSVQSPQTHAYNKDELQLIRTLANFTAVALSNALGFKELESQKQQIESQHQTLIDTQQQLVQSEKLVSLGILTAGIAHEINNPINFAQVGAQHLQSEFVNLEDFLLMMAADDADQEILDELKNRFAPLHKHIETIKEGTSRVSTIVKDLRFFTQLDKAEKNTVDINSCLQATVNLIKSSYANITEIQENYGPLPLLHCYPAKLNQVFMNLIVNASDSIREKIHNRELDRTGTIVITTTLEQQHIVISIQDNGNGMSEDTKKRLFEPFYTTKAIGEGTGLGLSISYGIIKDHHGEISVTSEQGIGSEFTIKLPISLP